jgi:hypothetical protein
LTEALESIPVIGEREEEGRGRLRVGQLREAVGGLRTRAAKRGIEAYLFVAGAVLVPLGILIVLLGWYGSAHTGFLFEQIPYLISGGMLGLSLVTVGSFAYFAFWMTRLYQQQQAHTDRTVEVLERLEQRLEDLRYLDGGSASSRGSGNGRATSTGDVSFVATQTGTMFHLPDCTVVANRPKLKKVTGNERNMEPCKLCDPLAAV